MLVSPLKSLSCLLFEEQNFTPLLWAAAGGHFQATKSLLEACGWMGDDMEKLSKPPIVTPPTPQ